MPGDILQALSVSSLKHYFAMTTFQAAILEVHIHFTSNKQHCTNRMISFFEQQQQNCMHHLKKIFCQYIATSVSISLPVAFCFHE